MNGDHQRGCEGRTYTCTCGYDDQLIWIGPDAVEKVARAIWEVQCERWGKYREQVPELCAWEDLSLSKQWELMAEATAAIAALKGEAA